MSIFRVTYHATEDGAPVLERYWDTELEGIAAYQIADDPCVETAWIVEGDDVTAWVIAAVTVDRSTISWRTEAERTVAIALVLRGECVWHAASIAMQSTCRCARCAPAANDDADDLEETRVFALAAT
jgi:hypothetical protein